MNELEITPHPEQQRALCELREEFRADNLKRIRSQFVGKHPLVWNMIGDPETARDKYDAKEWAREMDRRLCGPVIQDFGLSELTQEERRRAEERLARWAEDSIMEVTFPDNTEGTVDHDAPACRNVTEMTDDEICEYANFAVEESRNG